MKRTTVKKKPKGNKPTYKEIEILLQEFKEKKDEIQARLIKFKMIGQSSQNKVFSEMCFCILTPQSKARSCDKVMASLVRNNLLFKGSAKEIGRYLRSNVRFHNEKARFIVTARKELLQNGQWKLMDRLKKYEDPKAVREWLVENVLGLGYKEASHFLRNIGMGEQLAILDRHVIKNLQRHGVLKKVPRSLSKKEYLRIEDMMKEFSDYMEIPLPTLDLLFWSRETGEIFK